MTLNMMNMVVGARRTAVLSVSQTADLPGFSPRHNHLKTLQRTAPKREKYPVRLSCGGKCRVDVGWKVFESAYLPQLH